MFQPTKRKRKRKQEKLIEIFIVNSPNNRDCTLWNYVKLEKKTQNKEVTNMPI